MNVYLPIRIVIERPVEPVHRIHRGAATLPSQVAWVAEIHHVLHTISVGLHELERFHRIGNMVSAVHTAHIGASKISSAAGPLTIVLP